MFTLAIVLPCYNEEPLLESTVNRLLLLISEMRVEKMISGDSFILFVNDGSTDHTWECIERLHAENPMVKGLNLTHNVGHQIAIMAGMMTAVEHADGVVTIDADLQDDVTCIPEMVQYYREGYDVVYGVKDDRKKDPWLKRMTASAFYKLQKKMGVETVVNHADFRFLSKRVVMELARYQERNLYLRGIIPLMGYPSVTVSDSISERGVGKSKYTLCKMMSLALNGITSFSVTPMYAIMGVGVACVLIALCIGIYVLASLLTGNVVHGWSSLMLSIWFIGGVTLLSVGMVGLYVGRVYIESKQRPLYHVRDFLF
jgi:glycosyltransferase involved in cell wall biosynthesis